jgi:hypothetical protein
MPALGVGLAHAIDAGAINPDLQVCTPSAQRSPRCFRVVTHDHVKLTNPTLPASQDAPAAILKCSWAIRRAIGRAACRQPDAG